MHLQYLHMAATVDYGCGNSSHYLILEFTCLRPLLERFSQKKVTCLGLGKDMVMETNDNCKQETESSVLCYKSSIHLDLLTKRFCGSIL